MSSFRVQGNTPLKGTVKIGGAKNASFKLMIAAALGEGESQLDNMSKIGDVDVTYKTLRAIGLKVGRRDNGHRVLVEGGRLTTHTIPKFTGEKTRAATLFAGLLLGREGRGVIPLPGGCSLGDRPVDRHLDGLRALGATVVCTDIGIEMETPAGLQGATYRFPKKSHTGTESLLLAAVLAKGKTVIENAGLEPEIDDMIEFLVKMGAKVERVKINDSIVIHGVNKLHASKHIVMPDRNEAVSFACFAVATKGEIFVQGAVKSHIQAFLDQLETVGGGYEVGEGSIRFYYRSPLKATDLTTAPEPGFMTDWQPLWTTMMTSAVGVSHVVESVHNNRLAFTSELKRMGANIELYDPNPRDPENFYQFDWPERVKNMHAGRIIGPTPLQGTNLQVPDLRGGATLVMAAMMAQGSSTIKGIEHIDRGYENFDTRLRTLGGQIERI